MTAVSLPGAMHAAAAAMVVYAAGTSPFLLYRIPRLRMSKHPLPVATLSMIAITAVVTGLQLIFPEVLNALRRSPSAFSTNEWWRLLSPMFVQSDGWTQIIFNFLGIALIGPLVEWIFGSRHWLVLYFIPGLIGEIVAYAWDPYGAGSSLPLAGLVGGLFLWLLWRDSQLPRAVRVLGALGLLGAIALAALRDIHGPPLIVGACLAALMLWWESHTHRASLRGRATVLRPSANSRRSRITARRTRRRP